MQNLPPADKTEEESLPPGLGPEPDRQATALSRWMGAIAGILIGVVLAMLAAAWTHQMNPNGRSANMVWQIGGPTLALGLMFLFSLWFQRLFRERVLVPVALTLVIGLISFYLVFVAVGFPWRQTGGA